MIPMPPFGVLNPENICPVCHELKARDTMTCANCRDTTSKSKAGRKPTYPDHVLLALVRDGFNTPNKLLLALGLHSKTTLIKRLRRLHTEGRVTLVERTRREGMTVTIREADNG